MTSGITLIEPIALITGLPDELAPAQQQFNNLLARVEQLGQRLAETQALADTLRPLYGSTLQPLVARHTAALCEMAAWLDVRLQKTGLSPALRKAAQAMVCTLSEGPARAGNAAMRALHDRNSPQSLADLEKADAADLQAMVDRMAGVQPHLKIAPAGQLAGHTARRADKPRSAAQKKAHDKQQDVQHALRSIYRQLASALHPDREPDATARVRKTELMGQANTAYARRDLVALLTLQALCSHSDAAAMVRMTTEKMATLTRLLKEQAIAMQENLATAMDKVRDEFGLLACTPVTETELMRALDAQARSVAGALAVVQDDLQAMQTDAGLKRRVKQHKKMLAARDVLPAYDGL